MTARAEMFRFLKSWVLWTFGSGIVVAAGEG